MHRPEGRGMCNYEMRHGECRWPTRETKVMGGTTTTSPLYSCLCAGLLLADSQLLGLSIQFGLEGPTARGGLLPID